MKRLTPSQNLQRSLINTTSLNINSTLRKRHAVIHIIQRHRRARQEGRAQNAPVVIQVQKANILRTSDVIPAGKVAQRDINAVALAGRLARKAVGDVERGGDTVSRAVVGKKAIVVNQQTAACVEEVVVGLASLGDWQAVGVGARVDKTIVVCVGHGGDALKGDIWLGHVRPHGPRLLLVVHTRGTSSPRVLGAVDRREQTCRPARVFVDLARELVHPHEQNSTSDCNWPLSYAFLRNRGPAARLVSLMYGRQAHDSQGILGGCVCKYHRRQA